MIATLIAEQASAEGATAGAQRLIFDELAGTADLIKSFAIGLREAARRDDRQRVHGYLVDLVRCVGDARGAYARVSNLVKLETAR